MNFPRLTLHRSISRWLLVILFFMLIASSMGGPSLASANGNSFLPVSQPVPRFEPAPCMVDLPSGLVEGQNVDCGYLIVPEEHANPSGPVLKLGVAILHSQSPTPKPDPLVLLQGGPGGSTIETYMQAIPSNGRLWADRDIVMFDQRGTLYSKPGLDCPEFMDLMIATLDKDLSDEEDIRLSLDTLRSCRERLTSEGINLSAFDSIENAADVEDLRQALGYEKINLYGVSYGSLLAQHVMRFFPDGLRSVILDAVVPPQVNFNLNAPRTMNRAFEEMFTACAQDSDCNEAFPNLRDVFYQQVDRLNESPATIQLTDFETGNSYKALMDGETFMSGVFQMLYATEIIPFLPRVIYDARAGDYAFFSRIYSLFAFDRSLLYGMYYSVQCAEDADYSPEDYDLSGLPVQIREMEDYSAEFLLEACQVWNVEPVPPVVDEPVVSDIPTLILSGRFDPITPPAYGDLVAEGLSNSYSYVFADGGHGAAASGECQDQIILDFLANPNTPPDAGCINAIDGPEFITPGSLVRLPVLSKMMRLENGTGWQALIYLLALMFLLSALLIYPLMWFIRLFRNKPPRPDSAYSSAGEFRVGEDLSSTAGVSGTHRPGSSRISPWPAILSALVLLVFTAVLIGVVVSMAAANDIRILLGLPGAARPLFGLPPIALGLTGWMVVAAVLGWVRRSGSLAGRLYFTFLTLAALVCVIILAGWGMIAAILMS